MNDLINNPSHDPLSRHDMDVSDHNRKDMQDDNLEHMQHCRIIEALLFASPEPLSEKELIARLPGSVDIAQCMEDLASFYQSRGIIIRKTGDEWAFRTAPDLALFLTHLRIEKKKLSNAALETLAIIAYHQPVTRSEIEDIRGVSFSKGTIDILFENEWICVKGRKELPGRPLTYGTTPQFLDHFGLGNLSELPGIEELKALGLLEGQLPIAFSLQDDDENEEKSELPL